MITIAGNGSSSSLISRIIGTIAKTIINVAESWNAILIEGIADTE